jgi:hypothetical protein
MLRRRKKVLQEGYHCVLCPKGVDESAEHLFFNVHLLKVGGLQLASSGMRAPTSITNFTFPRRSSGSLSSWRSF